jgi:X-Pro dipeptidyl-peptidase (S15 family)/Carboxylesterase family
VVPQVTASDFNHFRFQGGSLNLETSLSWSTMMTDYAATGMRLSSMLLAGQRERKLERAYGHLPLGEADQFVVHQASQPFQDQLLHGPEDDYWKPVDYRARLEEVNAPAYLMGGWYDIFLDWQLKDYQALRGAGKQPYLLVGPWTHTSFTNGGKIIRETLAWLDTHVKGKREWLHEMPVQLFVMGENRWRHFADWPPSFQSERWYLQAGGGLAPTMPPASEPDRYRYDPADPTPAVGGNSLGAAKHMGPKDNRSLEARADVLVCASIRGRHPEPEKLVAAYRASCPDASSGELFSAIMTDWMFSIPSVRLAEAHAPHAGGTYLYEFAWPSPSFGGRLAACHGLELGFVFDTLDTPGLTGPQGLVGENPPVELARRMYSTWITFAKTGDPGWVPHNTQRGRPGITSTGPSSTLIQAICLLSLIRLCRSFACQS